VPSTQVLVTAAQGGDTAAFGELVRLYERAAVITAYATLRDYHSAQDVAQEAFITAYTKLTQLRQTAAFGPWLLQIVRRRALLMQQQPRPEPIGTEDIRSPSTGPSKGWIEQYEEVVSQIAQLSENDRTIVVMRYVDGRSVQEIAATIGRPTDTVRKQLFRAVERLRIRLKEVQV
jgi:RNA polymerase sigma-70 factor (ECF subfamily)